MAVSTFDALAATRALEAAGIDPKQAEAHAEQLRAAAGADLDHLATKTDLATVKTDINWLRWIGGINLAISLATLAAVLGIAWTLIQ